MKTYLITGAAQGLGRALTLALAKNGNQLIIIDKDQRTLNNLYDELEEKHDCKPMQLAMDLLGSNNQNYETVGESLEEQLSELDGVFLNAATLPACTPIEHTDFQQWYEVLHTNLNANFHLIQICLKLLSNTPNSKLVAMLDNNVIEAPAYYGAYGVAKAGLEQLMRTVSAETSNTEMTCLVARLPAFQSNTRSRQFPSENPDDIPTAEAIATQICQELAQSPETLNKDTLLQNI